MPDYGNSMMNGMNGGAAVNAVSTTSIALFAGDSTMLRFAFRNDTMFLSIIPCINDPASGKRRWPREMGHTVALRANQAAALWHAFEKAILPDMEKQQDHLGYAAVPLNRDGTNLCGFSYAGGRVCFSIFNNVGSDRTCNEISTFMFEPTPIINDYNPNTGSYNIMEVQGQVYVTVWAIKTFAELASNFVGHGAKNADAFNHDMMMSYLSAMITKLGVTPGGYGTYRGAGMRMAPMGGYSNDGPSATAGQSSLLQPPQGPSNDGVTWNSSMADSNMVGHTNLTPVQQVSELSELIG